MVINGTFIRAEFLLNIEPYPNLVPILGFLGSWKNPTHLVVALGATLWYVPIEDTTESVESAGSKDPLELTDTSLSVWFTYTGNDEAFLKAVGVV